MALVYKDCTPVGGIAHYCDPCDEGEKGRIRSIAFIAKSIASTIVAPWDLTTWLAAVEAETIHIIPQTSGTYDGGTPKEIPGFGDELTKKVGDDYVLTFKDPNYLENIAFYEALEKLEFIPAWRTETLVSFAGAGIKGCKVTAKAPVEDDLESIVAWNVEVKWFGESKPVSSATTPIVTLFSCFETDADS